MPGCALLLLGLLSAQAPPAEALPPLAPDPQLARGLELLQRNDIAAARRALESVHGPLALDDVVRLHESLGIACAYLDDVPAAERAFEHLLAVAPGHVLPYTISPRATFVFDRVRRRMSLQRATEVRLEQPPAIPFGQTATVSLVCEASALDLVHEWELCHRVKGEASYLCARAAARGLGEPVVFTLPPVAAPAEPGAQASRDDAPSALLQIAISGYDAAGNEVYRGPSRSQPVELAAGGELPVPWYANAWLWASLGAGALALSATAVTLAVLLQPTDAQVAAWVE